MYDTYAVVMVTFYKYVKVKEKSTYWIRLK